MKKPLLALALALGTLPAIAAPAADAIPKHLDATLPDDIATRTRRHKWRP